MSLIREPETCTHKERVDWSGSAFALPLPLGSFRVTFAGNFLTELSCRCDG